MLLPPSRTKTQHNDDAIHSMDTTVGEDTEGWSAEVESSLRKRKASDQVSRFVDRLHKRLSVEDHFPRDEAVQAVVERIDTLLAKNNDLELKATEGNANVRENEGKTIRNAFPELELEKMKYLVECKEGNIASLEGDIRHLESQNSERKSTRKRPEANLKVKPLTEEPSGAKDWVDAFEVQIEKVEERIKIRDE